MSQDHILSQMNEIPNFEIFSLKIHFNIILSRTCLGILNSLHLVLLIVQFHVHNMTFSIHSSVIITKMTVRFL
jgi:hypothetical protein